MGLVSSIVGLPVLPVRGVVALSRIIHQRTEQEMRDPSAARRQLEEVEEARRAGEVSEAEEADVQERVVESMIESTSGGSAEATGEATER